MPTMSMGSRRSKTTAPICLGKTQGGVSAIATTTSASPSAIPKTSARRAEDEPELTLATGTTVGPSVAGCRCVISGGGGGPVLVEAATTAAFFFFF